MSLSVVDAIEDAEILNLGGARFSLVGDALSQQVERSGDPAGIQRPDGGECIVERFAGDEPTSKLFGESVVAYEPEDSRLIRQIQQR